MGVSKNSIIGRLFFLVLFGALTIASGCKKPEDSLERIKDAGVLRVLTRNGPTTYYESQGRPTGFEYH
ncbi:MAG: hypothetical protein ACPHN3_11640, partial [Spongiibacter sp.]